jgi:hypothetical protein
MVRYFEFLSKGCIRFAKNLDVVECVFAIRFNSNRSFFVVSVRVWLGLVLLNKVTFVITLSAPDGYK